MDPLQAKKWEFALRPNHSPTPEIDPRTVNDIVHTSGEHPVPDADLQSIATESLEEARQIHLSFSDLAEEGVVYVATPSRYTKNKSKVSLEFLSAAGNQPVGYNDGVNVFRLGKNAINHPDFSEALPCGFVFVDQAPIRAGVAQWSRGSSSPAIS